MKTKRNTFLLNFSYIMVIILLNGCYANSDDRKIRNAINDFEKNLFSGRYAADGYFNEVLIHDQRIISHTDAYGFILSAGDDYPIKLDNFSFLPESIRKNSRSQDDIQNYLNNLYEVSETTYQEDIIPGYNSLFNALRLFQLQGPLKMENYSNFSFKCDNQEDGKTKISFKPSSTSSNYQFSGSFYLQEDLKIKVVQLNSFGSFFSYPFYKRIDSGFNIELETINGKYYVTHLEALYDHEDLNHSVSLEIKIESLNYKNFSERDYNMLFTYDHNPLIRYDAAFWEREFLKTFNSFDPEEISNLGRENFIKIPNSII